MKKTKYLCSLVSNFRLRQIQVIFMQLDITNYMSSKMRRISRHLMVQQSDPCIAERSDWIER